MAVSYNSGIGRYILTTEHTKSHAGNLGNFDAPEPWGPWTTVGYYSNWQGFDNPFYWNFSNKWLSEDGLDFTLIFTGVKANDSWNTIRGRFKLAPTIPPEPSLIPGRLEAEDYKVGGEGVGYHDATPGNSGGQFRSDDVDIEVTTDAGGGYNVGWSDPGEWLAFDVEIAQAGAYDLTARMAFGAAGTKTLHVEVDGVDVSGP
jgi:Carbohydrate binding module (family 6)